MSGVIFLALGPFERFLECGLLGLVIVCCERARLTRALWAGTHTLNIQHGSAGARFVGLHTNAKHQTRTG